MLIVKLLLIYSFKKFNLDYIWVIIGVTGSKPMGQWVIRINACDPVAMLIYMYDMCNGIVASIQNTIWPLLCM